MESCADLLRVWYTKHLFWFSRTFAMERKMKMRVDVICPCCRKQGTVDNCQHTWECTHPVRVEEFNSGVEDLQDWLWRSKTEPRLRKFLVLYVKARGSISFCALNNLPPDLLDIAMEQDLIGWTALLMGRFSQSIHSFQETYYNSIGKNRSIRTWCGLLAKKLMLLTHRQ